MKRFLILTLLLLTAATAPAQDEGLYGPFLNPEKTYRPRVWWHWMNGNITPDGVRKDLAWMDRAGISGFYLFDAGLDTPQVVDRRRVFMTPAWKEVFREALYIADSLGMEAAIASSPGWSITGGPWVSEDDAEKKLVWRECVIQGGRTYKDELPAPYRNAGPYQDLLAFPEDPGRYASYHDICVLAVRLPESEARALELRPSFSTSDPRYNGFILDDGDLHVADSLRTGQDGYAWIEWSFPEAETMRSVLLAESTDAPLCLEADTDGDGYFETQLADFPVADNAPVPVRCFDFAATKAYAFRLRCTETGRALHVSEARISPIVRVQYGSFKAGFFTSWAISDRFPTPEAGEVASTTDVIDLTARVRNGILQWQVPEGTWRIFRFGYNLLGRVNGPASPEATGLEVDKLDADAIRRYYDNYLGLYRDASGDRLGKTIRCLQIDSYESGLCTWTPAIEKAFRRRNGYALRPWLPVLTGQVLESAERSEQFLFDWRATLGEMMARSHYDAVDRILEDYGMERHSEAHERRTAFVGDGMRIKRDAKVPMSAIWVHYRDGWYSSYPVAEADIRESASVAHIYGQNVCAAESFTVNGKIGKFDGFGAYQGAPCNLKRLADAAMSEGVNRFVIHTSVHQPCDSLIPGLSLGPYGQYFNRHDTWAEEARPWTDYLSRSSYLLQQGRWAADIAWFYGEDKNATAVYYEHGVPVPQGYNYDFVNADVLLHRLRLQGDALVTRSGMRYRALVLDPELRYMSLPVLRRIRRFARAGVFIYGPKPVGKAGLKGSDRRFRRIADRLWDSGRFPVRSGDVSLAFALAEAGIGKDVEWFLPGPAADVRFVHRHLPDGELYWIANISPEGRRLKVSFAVSGFAPKVWHADTGLREQPSWRRVSDHTEVDLDLEPDDAQFVFFTRPTDALSYAAPAREEVVLTALEGPWTLSFQPGRGAPEGPVVWKARAGGGTGLSAVAKASAPADHGKGDTPVLPSLSESPVEGIRYFSGTVTYRTVFTIKPDPADTGMIAETATLAAGQRAADSAYTRAVEYWLDLGEVHHMARILLNGHDLGLAWKTPYRLPLGEALRDGMNELEIRVTDSWANRLIGDVRKPSEDRLTYTAVPFYTAEDAPIPAGLIGPVRLLRITPASGE
ncbi:MAG: glycoside hydrolase family 2 [Bacteroidales bacterium]|nr:glycoside hydrolase family 2 [Bacteroidales bacterium]